MHRDYVGRRGHVDENKWVPGKGRAPKVTLRPSRPGLAARLVPVGPDNRHEARDRAASRS